MDQDLQTVLNLPLETIAVLAAGYLGYRAAFAGNDHQMQTADIVFSSLVFALVAKVAIWLASLWLPMMLAAVIAVPAAVLAALIWRRWGYGAWRKVGRRVGLVTADRHQTVMQTVVATEGMRPSQMSVRLNNGEALMCDVLANFNDKPHGPCLWGPDGSVAMYVTSRRKAGSDEWEDINPTDEAWGSVLTILPADQVEEINIRYMP